MATTFQDGFQGPASKGISALVLIRDACMLGSLKAMVSRTIDQRCGPNFEIATESHVKAETLAIDDFRMPNRICGRNDKWNDTLQQQTSVARLLYVGPRKIAPSS